MGVCDGFLKGGRKEEMRGTGEVLMAGNAGGIAVDQINLLQLDEYLRESRIARKVSGLMIQPRDHVCSRCWYRLLLLRIADWELR